MITYDPSSALHDQLHRVSLTTGVLDSIFRNPVTDSWITIPNRIEGFNITVYGYQRQRHIYVCEIIVSLVVLFMVLFTENNINI